MTDAATLEASVAGPGIAPRDHNLPTGDEVLVMVAKDPSLPLTDDAIRDALIAKLAADVDAHEPDTSTEAGRKAIREIERRISGVKSNIGDAGLKLTKDLRDKVAAINAVRDDVKTALQQLQDRVAGPLTAWKAAEEARQVEVQRVNDRLNAMIRHDAFTDSATIIARIAEAETMAFDPAIFSEGTNAIEELRDKVLTKLREMKASAEASEAQQRELEQLRAEAAERARADAEREAEEQRKHEDVKQQAEAARRVEQERARIAEQARLDAEAEAQRKIDEANERAAAAEREAQAERERIAQQARADEAARQRKADEDAARQRDQQHRAKIHAEAKGALIECGLTERKAGQLVLAIAAGSVPHVSIEY